MRPHISIRGFVRPSVGRLIRPLFDNVFVKLGKNGFLRILNNLDSAGRGGKRDELEGATRRKEGRGGRRDEEEGGTRRKE